MAFLPSWLIGAMLSIIGSVFSNFGVNIQKYSAMKEELKDIDIEEMRTYWKQPLWVIGFGFVFFGALFDFAALAFAAQSVVATVGSTTLVANIFFAHFWLGEALYALDFLGTFLIVSGATIAVAFGDQTEVNYTMDDLTERYIAPEFVVYIIASGSAMVILYLFIRVAEPLKDRIMIAKKTLAKHAEDYNVKLILDAEKELAMLQRKYRYYEKIHPFAYCALAGFMGSLTLIFAKSIAEMLRATVEGNNQFFNPFTYLFIVGMVLAVTTETHFLATGLKHFDALYIVPAGGVYFGEFSRFGRRQMIFFPVGVSITLIGVYLLTSRKMGDDEDDDDEMLDGKAGGFVGERSRRPTDSRSRAQTLDGDVVNLHDIGESDSEPEVDYVAKSRRISGMSPSEARDIVPEMDRNAISTLHLEVFANAKVPPPRTSTTPGNRKHPRDKASRTYNRVMKAQSRMFSGGSVIFSQLAQLGVRKVFDQSKLKQADQINAAVSRHMHKRERSQSMRFSSHGNATNGGPRTVFSGPATKSYETKKGHHRVRSATDHPNRPTLARVASSPVGTRAHMDALVELGGSTKKLNGNNNNDQDENHITSSSTANSPKESTIQINQ